MPARRSAFASAHRRSTRRAAECSPTDRPPRARERGRAPRGAKRSRARSPTGALYKFWTFGGTVPGPMIRVRRGDIVELHLKNHPSNTMPHNIDLHAVTGPGGGATSTFTAPGHQTQFIVPGAQSGRVRLPLRDGAGRHARRERHVRHDRRRARRGPRPPVDHEYYVMQGDFYTRGEYREPGLQPFDMQRAIDEDPTYVLFNGRDGALTATTRSTANVGETRAHLLRRRRTEPCQLVPRHRRDLRPRLGRGRRRSG